MKKVLLIIIMLLIFSSFVSAKFLSFKEFLSSKKIMTIKYTTAHHPEMSALWQINHITIYDYDSKTAEKIYDELVHEYVHQLCYDLFDIYPEGLKDHSDRCFTNGGILLIS